MSECTNPDIGERLLAAVWQEEFPDEQAQIEAHLAECPHCREELRMLKQLCTTFSAHRTELGQALSECPSVEDIVAFAESGKPNIEAHLASCADCREQVQMVREVARDVAEEKSRIAACTVSPPYQESATTKPSLLRSLLDWLTAVHFSSFLVGAVAAAVLAVIVMPRQPVTTPAPIQPPLRLALSDAVWQEPTPRPDKGGRIMSPGATKRKEVALVILVGERSPLTSKDLDDIYRWIEIPDTLVRDYRFIVPADVKKLLESSTDAIHSEKSLAEAVFAKTDSTYVVAVELDREHAGSLRATIWARGKETPLGSISQTGLKRDRLPERIMGITGELLDEVP